MWPGELVAENTESRCHTAVALSLWRTEAATLEVAH